MILGLLMGCNNRVAELEKKSNFYESVVKIGQGFQEIFGIFGKAMGDDFGIVKSDDTRDKVGVHFEKVKQGLEGTKNQLSDLLSKISEAKNANTKGVEGVISSASGVLTKLIESVGKLAGVTKGASDIEIGATVNTGAALPANSTDVETVIKEVKNIVDAAEKSGVEIEDGGKVGVQETAGQANAPAALVASDAAQAQSGPKLADAVAKADLWAIIDKIKNANTSDTLGSNSNNTVGALATKVAAANTTGAKSTADLAAAVALKAMTKDGKFSNAANEAPAVKASATIAVNKVIGVLDEIIRRTVSKELYKVGKAVNGMQYSKNTAEKSEASATK